MKKNVFVGIFVDIMITLGFASVVYGVYNIYEPASFIVGGSMLLYAFTRDRKN
jgi:hypothetical protein